MKKLLCITLSIIALIGCFGCQKQEQTGNTVNFYYRANEPKYGSGDGIYSIEVREVTYELTDYQKIIEDYLRGARITTGVSPFPPGTTLVNLSIKNSDLTIELSPHMALQSNAEVIVCCACLCKTLFSLPDVRKVTFSIENREINGEESITFDKNSFVNWNMLS